jgi:hypothetical protein
VRSYPRSLLRSYVRLQNPGAPDGAHFVCWRAPKSSRSIINLTDDAENARRALDEAERRQIGGGIDSGAGTPLGEA